MVQPQQRELHDHYRVDDLEALFAQLRSDEVEIVGEPQSDDNGHFAWVLDPDGNKVELWQPIARAEKGDAT